MKRTGTSFFEGLFAVFRTGNDQREKGGRPALKVQGSRIEPRTAAWGTWSAITHHAGLRVTVFQGFLNCYASYCMSSRPVFLIDLNIYLKMLLATFFQLTSFVYKFNTKKVFPYDFIIAPFFLVNLFYLTASPD